ncbi:TPA: hypothetical protein KSL21_001523 [Clostridioides difficile]|uniref:transglutaminase domain-containing protein n=1 Tax=Clostridioides difficile TaxID=1496 RepID=UPI0002DDF345|nr:putative exported protein [Clostridioides difficile]EGT2229444.1 hypothetical protein [Clostridioides difficile]EGT4164508.1 hypothetical protein [Clostridioides difficile]EGT4249958.1 hypothetical protein [Clostridioides difficile]EGT4519061.1 hypothetical protein [Clostridioides difficile]EGT4637367.1 hypothetical protein [Clostridioides difficile]
MKKNILTTMITMIIILMMSMTVMAEPYQEDETSSLKKQSANERNQTNVGTMDGRVQTNAISKGANYDPKYPLKGMLTQLGLNTTGKEGWDLLYGGNPNGVELRADGKYYYINKGMEGLGFYAAALSGGSYQRIGFGKLDPIEVIADGNWISYKQAQDTLAVIRNFLNSFDWRNASEMERANRAAKLVTEAKYADSKYCNIVYGNLVDKRGVCGSFASSFHLLTRLMGMDSLSILNPSLNHAWNYIQIDGKWYRFDGSEISAFGGSLDFDYRKLKDATREMTTYYDTKALSILGFNQ